MSIVTCDVVEAGATASSSMLVAVTSLLETVGFSTSALIWVISSLLVDSSATATSYVDLQPVVSIMDKITAHDTWTTQANLNWLVVEKVKVTDSAFNSPTNDVIETATSSTSLVASRTLSVLEKITALDTPILVNNAPVSVVEKATARDSLFGFNDFVFTDHITAHETLLLYSGTAATLIDATATASDEALIDGAFDNVLTATGYASSSMVTQSVVSAMLTERITARARALLALFGQGWVMNSENFGMSRYTEMPVATLAVVGGRVLALGDTGLYELAGDTDEGELIAASITSGRLMLGSAYKKRIPDVFITGTFGDEMALTVGVYGAVKGSYTYTVPRRDADSPRGTRVGLGKGLASTYWKFSIANKNGGDFNIDTMNADVAPSTTRRI